MVLLLQSGRCYEANSTPLEMCFCVVSFFAKVTHICTSSGDVLYPFPSFRTHNSSLEGAMELKFAPFYSS